mgnify:FL=1
MTKQEVAVRLLKAIFLEVISIALILIGYVISGGENNGVTTFLIVLGLILFFIGGFMGVGAFFASTTKEN